MKKLISLTLIICFMLSLASCSGPISDSEAVEILIPLLEREAELNGYIYGSSFGTSQDPGDDVNANYAKYYEVSEIDKYRSVDALKKEISAVYTEETSDIIAIYAFNGYTDDVDGGASVTPRFSETKEGVLQIDVAKEPYEMRGVIHPSTAKVKRSTKRMMKVVVEYSRFSEDGTEKIVKKELTLKLVDGSWRLNTQTFAIKSEG